LFDGKIGVSACLSSPHWSSHSSQKDCIRCKKSVILIPEGGVLLFDSLVFHAPGKNTTEDTRMVATMGYHSVDELSGKSDTKLMLVHGEQLYRGNDIHLTSHE
jgi:ectoine hydroxylase-related dioxygenase (phytanoyl-CoA dioxygenase family)